MKSLAFLFYFGFSLLLGSSSLAAQDSVSLFVSANQAFMDQDFLKAEAQYEELLEAGHQNGHLYYNLGNTHYRLGNLGKAIGNYLKAKNFLPTHEDLNANLQYLRGKTKDQRESEEASWATIFQDWTAPLSLSSWSILLLIANALFWGLALLSLFKSREIVSWLLVFAGVLTLAVMVATGLKWLSFQPMGVILESEISVMSAPHQDSKVLFVLHEGTETKVGEVRDNWTEIEFEPTKKGWVPNPSLMTISLID